MQGDLWVLSCLGLLQHDYSCWLVSSDLYPWKEGQDASLSGDIICLLLKKSERKVWLTRSTIHHLKWKVSTLRPGKKSNFPSIDSVHRTLGCIYRYAFLGWVRELPSTFIVAFTFDSSCRVESLESVTQYPWVSQVSQPDLLETHFMGSFSFTPCILHRC